MRDSDNMYKESVQPINRTCNGHIQNIARRLLHVTGGIQTIAWQKMETRATNDKGHWAGLYLIFNHNPGSFWPIVSLFKLRKAIRKPCVPVFVKLNRAESVRGKP